MDVSVIENEAPEQRQPDRGGRAGRWFDTVLTRARGLAAARPVDALALGAWLLSRLGVLVVLWITTWVSSPNSAHSPDTGGGVWERWDVVRYIQIAADGYSAAGRHGASIAFFPGMPGALFAVHLVVRSWVFSGLLISFVSGAVACVALARIIALESARLGVAADDPARGQAAVRNGLTFWLCSPAAVFLAVGYTESLFLAFALPAWLAARRQKWLTAGLLIAGAMAVRIDGVFLLAAIAVLFAQTRPRTRSDWLTGSPLLIGLVPLIAFFTYLKVLTGSWMAWNHAESSGWDRKLTEPIRTFLNTWHYAFGGILPANWAWEYQVEFLAVAVGVVAFIWTVSWRRWAEATYLGLALVSLMTSHVYLSVTRELLLWWPIWAAAGVWAVRRPWVKTVALTVSAPISFAVCYLFFTGHWAG